MAVTANHLTTDFSESDATSYNTASVTIAANKLALLVVRNLYGGAANKPTVSGWVEVTSKQSADTVVYITLFRSLSASPRTGAITIDFAGQTQARCEWSLVEFDGVVTTGTNGADAVVQSASAEVLGATPNTGISVTLGAFSDTANATYGGMVTNSATSPTPGSGFTKIGESNDSNQSIQTQWKSTNDTGVDWTWASESIYGLAIAAELKAQSASGFFAIL